MNYYSSDFCSIIFCFADQQNHMRIHPMFLHSNATSHKWAFGGTNFHLYVSFASADHVLAERNQGLLKLNAEK